MAFVGGTVGALVTVDLRKYVRVYYDDLAHEFPEVYADDALLSTWLRLLVVAERMWPAPPELPRAVRSRALGRLVEYELIELLPAHCYRIRGLDAERTRRQTAARNAAAKRWHSGSTATGNAPASASAMPSREQAVNESETKIPPPPAERGRRDEGTSLRQRSSAPRDIGTNPRANGGSIRQQRQAQKRAGFSESVASILSRAAQAGKPEKQAG